MTPEEFQGDPGHRPPGAPSPQQELIEHIAGYRGAGVKYVLTDPNDALPPSLFTLVSRSPTTWIYRIGEVAPYMSALDPTCALSAVERESVRISCRKPTVLIRRETYLAGWTANVDGHDAPIRETEIFQSLNVPAGTHQVTFSYAPPRIGLGYAGFAVGLIWLLFGLRPPAAWRRSLLRLVGRRTGGATPPRPRTDGSSSGGSPAA